jgi:peptide/nickel transport system permease protein
MTDTRVTTAAGIMAKRRDDGDSLLKQTVRRLLRNPMGLAGVSIVGGLVLIGFVAPLIVPHDPIQQFRGHRLEAPSLEFWFGTDHLSRDVFARTLYGLRASILISILAAGGGGIVGATAGFVAGYVGGFVETVIMRFVDILFAFPGLLLALALIATLGSTQRNVAIGIGIASFPIFARLARGQMLVEVTQDYVLAARAMGARDVRIIARHIAINASPPLLVQGALSMAIAVLLEAALGFLGLGTTPPDPSLGQLINDARSRLEYPHLLLFPAVFLAVFIFGLNLLADSLNDVLDPHRPRR